MKIITITKMKKMISLKTITWLIVMAAMTSGCVSYKPLGSKSTPDYNGRVKVNNAQFEKKANAGGWIFSVGLIGAGGYFGSQSSIVKIKNKDGVNEVSKAGGAVVGALGGVLVSTLFNSIAGYGKTVEVKDPMQWIRKSQKGFIYLHGGNSQFTMINPRAEENYKVANLQDVRDFKTAFPRSTKHEDVVAKAIPVLTRAEMLGLLDVYPATRHGQQIKAAYLENSASVKACIEAGQKFPELAGDAETKALGLIKNMADAEAFTATYSKEKHENEIVKKLLQNGESNYAAIIRMFPNHQETQPLKYKIMRQAKTIDDLAIFYANYPDVREDSIKAFLASNQLITKLEDFKTAKSRFPKIMDGEVARAVIVWTYAVGGSVPATAFYDLAQLFPDARESFMMDYTYAMHTLYQKYIDARSLEGIQELNSAFDGYPDPDGWRKQGLFWADYLSCLDARSIEEYARFAGKYPEKYAEMDDLAFKETSPKDSRECNLYLTYFANGSHRSVVTQLLAEAKEYEANESCHVCNGTGNCFTCNGRGMVPCKQCNGTGEYYHKSTGWLDRSEMRYCEVCNRKGQYMCSSCSGRGICPKCNGTKKEHNHNH
jgi:hypothetical protein